MKFTQKILECNNPTLNGRIYSKDVVQKSLDINSNLFGYTTDIDIISQPVNEIAFALSKYWWEDNILYGEFDVLDTPKGRELESLINYTKNLLKIYPEGLGNVSSDGEVYDYSLMSFCIKI